MKKHQPISNTAPVAILGAGAFGTALAIQLARCGQLVRLWGRSAAHMQQLADTRMNAHYLPNAAFPENMTCTATLSEALDQVQEIVVAVPSGAVPFLWEELSSLRIEGYSLLMTSKGLPFASTELLSSWLDKKGMAYTLLSGPSFAKEVAQGLPTTWVMASCQLDCLQAWQARFLRTNSQVLLSRDVTGVSLYGAMKNIVAIAVGMAVGSSLGENTAMLLMMQGVREMRELGSRMGAREATMMSAAGIGDLALTCTSHQSRNRQLGIKIGEGFTYPEAQHALNVLSEGANNIQAICQLAENHQLTLPLCQMVYTTLFNEIKARTAIFSFLHSVNPHVALEY